MGGLLDLVGESKVLNSKLFTLPRLLILSALFELPREECVTFRELKVGLKLSDGTLYANLNALIAAGYALKKDVKLEKEMTSYQITDLGRADFVALRNWLKKWDVWMEGEHGKHR